MKKKVLRKNIYKGYTAKGLLSRIYKELLKLNNKKIRNSFKKRAKDLNKQNTDEIQKKEGNCLMV